MGLLFASWLLFLFIQAVLLMFLFCLGSGLPQAASSVHGGNETDQLALLSFKAEITGDPFGALNSWNESIHFCQWVGVTCGRRHKRVIVLKLDHLKLTGSISPHVGNLSFLRELTLGNNSLSHKIPPELGRLPRMRIMWLLHNSFSGEIPANISACSNLVDLDFSGNMLEGKIPVELGSLSKLDVLYIDSNKLIADVPSTLRNLSSLKELIAQYNSISGNIPNALGRLKNLQVLALGIYRLVGTIPSSTFNLSSITVFNVIMNQIQRSLPSDLGITLPNLKLLEVTGSIPFSESNATKLYYLGFGYIKFTGKVPPLEKLHDLEKLFCHTNQLGTGEANDLNFLYSLTNATNLHKLDISNNNFGGVCPEAISNFCTTLGQLNIQNNRIVGRIPNGIGNLVNLEEIDFSNNHFTGNIIADIGKLTKLQNLFLSRNKFCGDMLSGKIPSTLGSCVKLTFLYMQGNNFSGILPSSLSNLRGIEELNLSYNNFSGKIPIYLEGFVFLRILDLSFNNFDGLVPESGIFKNATGFSVEGNKQLCGGIPELQLQCCNSKGSRRKKFTLTLKLIIPTSVGLVGLILILYFLYLDWFRKTKKVPTFRFLGSSFLKLSYQSLLKATDGFSQANLIGVGS